MKISIIIPTLNSGKYLKKCLDSIFNQQYQDFEVIIVDGYSTDNTGDIFKEYQSVHKNMSVIFRSPCGEPDAINVGIESSSGDIVAFIDSDDVYDYSAFRRAIDYFDGHPDVSLVYGKANIIGSDDERRRSVITDAKKPFQKWNMQWLLLLLDYIVQPTVFMRRSMIDKIGLFHSDKLVTDYEYWLRAYSSGYKFGFIDSKIADYRVHSDTMSSQYQTQQINDAFRWKKYYAKMMKKSWLIPLQSCEYLIERLLYRIVK
jgi:glycosyltransferase involved in cell wall biosynthesis